MQIKIITNSKKTKNARTEYLTEDKKTIDFRAQKYLRLRSKFNSMRNQQLATMGSKDN